ncbi:sugar phosphate isomerase/epimerase [Salegentibacter sp. BDJ18]|uniref:sugar phosphate isomerase/epimerase family protein n=1 Tax=Salegentibacter sp. BDJ18 TaxID=2816376 RepID=UPI001AAE5245|nr:sugar phosphate isomerase/epimerase [Salegentibacter sp. BDJ18]MBO2543591.1 sugar phosphate isomerase/epimerase [Salegentibacter sp. BDJ18]
MKKINLLLLLLVLLIQPVIAQQNSNKELDWKLGAQAYTFKNFTFAEALNKISSIDLKYVEAYPGQEIGNSIEGTMHYGMNANTKKKVKKLLNSKGIQLVAYGVVSGENEADWKELFEFAQDMGIDIITSEPEKEDLDMVNRLAREYNIKVALHNHPKPSTYWHPNTVLEALEGRENIKACADVGHWIRSGLNPVESLKKLEGQIASLHFKDLNEKSRDAHDVPWGTGISDVEAMLKELKRQKFGGLFSIEYEHNWDNSLPEIEKSVDYFKKMVK